MLENMPLTDWISLAACIGHLALTLVVLVRGAGSPLRIPLVLLTFDFFVWNFAQWAHRMSGDAMWHWLDTTFSPMGAPLAFLVITIFVGRSRQLRPFVIAAFALFGVLSLWSASGFFDPTLNRLVDRKVWWSDAFLVLLVPVFVTTLALLGIHLRKATGFTEQMSTRLLIAALVVGNVLGATELWEDVFPAAALGNVGTLASTALVAVVVLRYRLLAKGSSLLVPLYALTVGALGVLGYLAVFSLLDTHVALLVFGTSIVTLVLALVAKDVFAAVAAAREQTRHLATLGRFSAQLAHDIRNPLSALKGALQFMQEEGKRGRSIDEHLDFIDLSVEQVRRIEAVVTKYQRLGMVAPDSQPVDLNALVSSVWAGVRSARDVSSVTPVLELHEELPKCRADSDLLGMAIQNLVINALDAMPSGGTLTIQTLAADDQVAVDVADTGVGMDPRQRERVFDDFFTTKAEGSGLGLGFVQRVVAAHGGQIELDSQLGKGTAFRLVLPHASPTQSGGQSED